MWVLVVLELVLLGWCCRCGVIVGGAGVVMAWIALGWNSEVLGSPGVYEIIPGFAASWLAIWLVSKATANVAEGGAQTV